MGRRPNYNYEKRQKEIKRAKKKEEKLARKQAKREGGEGSEGAPPQEGEATSEEAHPAVSESNAPGGPGL